MLTIEHTEAEGTLLLGTSRGDGSAEVVKGLGWRWGRSIGLWFVPRSRDAVPKRDLIERTAHALRAAGFEVSVAIDAAVGDRVAAEQRIVDRSEARADRLDARAEREQRKSDAREAAFHQLTDGIPLGQPLLAGHHSYPAAKRRQERAVRHVAASVEHQRNADAAAAAAQTARRRPDYRQSPVTVANRIERLAAEVRRQERDLAKVAPDFVPESASSWVVQVREQLERDRADLAYWEQVRAEQVKAGVATDYGPGTVAAGDLVKIGGDWFRVVRANAKTVRVEVRFGIPTVPWYKVEDHRPAV